MGKVAIGCFVVLLAAAVFGGGLVWFKVVKPGMDFAGSVVSFGEEFERLDRSVRDRSTYLPPADEIVAEPQLQRFLAAQTGIRTRLEAHLDELNQKYSELDARLKQAGGKPNLRDIAGAYQDFGSLLLEAKRAQVAALNSHDFSVQEYAWVRQQVYRALGESVGVAALASGGDGPSPAGAAPAENIERIAPYRETLMETHVLAWWGL